MGKKQVNYVANNFFVTAIGGTIAGLLIMITIASLITSCATTGQNSKQPESYQPENKELYNTISRLDSVFWKAYNECDMNTQARLYSENIEFYHDQAGLINSRQMILDATEANICGKIQRDIVKGTLEVYPLPGYGAVEIGMHTFRDLDNGGQPSRPGKFITIWQQKGSEWTITRVVSIH